MSVPLPTKGLPRVQCPHCERELDQSLLLRYVGGVLSGMRKVHKGAEPVVYRCGCGRLFSAREIREHRCAYKPPRGKETKATKAEIERYFAHRARKAAGKLATWSPREPVLR